MRWSTKGQSYLMCLYANSIALKWKSYDFLVGGLFEGFFLGSV